MMADGPLGVAGLVVVTMVVGLAVGVPGTQIR
jgi:hypothetical protein